MGKSKVLKSQHKWLSNAPGTEIGKYYKGMNKNIGKQGIKFLSIWPVETESIEFIPIVILPEFLELNNFLINKSSLFSIQTSSEIDIFMIIQEGIL